MTNLLLLANGYPREIPVHISQKLKVENVFLISDGHPTYDISGYHDFRDCTFGDFHDRDKYLDLPLDKSLLEGMSVCESHVLKMMDRYQHIQGLLYYEERIDLYHKQLRYWYNYLLKNKINVCVFVVIPHVIFDYIIYCLCKYLGIKVILFYRTTILLDRNVSIYDMEDLETHMHKISQRYEYYISNPEALELSDRVKSYLDLRGGNENKTFTGVSSKWDWRKYLSLQRYIKGFKYRIDNYLHWRKWKRPLDFILNSIHKISKKGMSVYSPSFKQDIDMEQPFIYVSLHYQPECSTSPMGGYFVHQDIMLDVLMQSVPKDIKIYVKAHLRDGYSDAFIRRMHYDERTVLIEPSMNSFSLIQKSLAVATVTGTAGWEAFINNKPVLMFGRYFYQDAPGVHQVETVEECKEAVSKILSGESKITNDMVFAFLKALDDLSFPGWVDNRYGNMSPITDEQNCTNIASQITNTLMQKEAE